MGDSREQTANGHFDCSDSERAAFEAGIKMGTIYHQFVGIPVSADNAQTLERAIEEGCKVQPFVESVRVRIDRARLKSKRGEFDYVSLTGEMLDVNLVVRYKTSRVEARMEFVEDMSYPLMFIKSIETV
ncbi:MAG: dihydroneopterin aldolase family protein [Methanobacteriota archaeon]|nr:MAG: dihydroneopterin aldolase family protein [Euryarchaeota archaeon]